jgi:hypothetical protein
MGMYSFSRRVLPPRVENAEPSVDEFCFLRREASLAFGSVSHYMGSEAESARSSTGAGCMNA